MFNNKELEKFNWFECPISVSELIERNLPRLDNEFTINNQEVSILIIENEVIQTSLVRISFVFKGKFIPVYDDESLFIQYEGTMATRRFEDFLYLGVKKNVN
ncbi:hypothetical protein [Aliivibrio fischeri]|uniref:hypothetical protein n=1 Tax=Aliivibrio fischeri TaxID=668 RepID=UPI0013A59ABB|nr:hypothetical protein [Aliivibrio fischeri]